MLHRTQARLCLLATSLILILCSLAAVAQGKPSNRGRKFKPPPPSARIEVTVLRDVNGKPIENAAVIFHSVEGGRDKSNMELKTNEDGRSIIDVFPVGDMVRLQIIAKGFQTYGQEFKVEKPEMTFEIRMKRPGEQYSIYKDHPEENGAGKGTEAGKPANQPSGSAKDDGKASGSASDAASAPASRDKPAAQKDAQPSQSQPPK
jgi:5-hydroxyisourate hydrolase-like protein (transthyretin family)